MQDYKVMWEIDIYANSPEEAAKAARDIQLRSDSTAVVFDVFNSIGNVKRVDLMEGGL